MADTAVMAKTIWQPKLANGPKPMRVWGKEGITRPCIAAGGSDGAEARVALLGEAVCDSDANGGSLGVKIRRRRTGHKVEATGIRVDNARMGGR